MNPNKWCPMSDCFDMTKIFKYTNITLHNNSGQYNSTITIDSNKTQQHHVSGQHAN